MKFLSLETNLADWYRKKVNKEYSKTIRVSIPDNGVEEFVDDF
jgi:hypothetical protein